MRPSPLPTETSGSGRWFRAVLLCAVLQTSSEALALERFHFEPPYLIDPGRTMKDHSMVYQQGMWHCFYIRGEDSQGNQTEDELGHAITEDLREWTILPPAIVSGPELWDDRNVWAPCVIPSPGMGGGWTMFYTGADNLVVQRMGRAFTTNPSLTGWSKYLLNPEFEPDSAEYLWAPDLSFSAFRDPFYFFHEGEHHILNTAVIPDTTIAAGRRGVVHHITSTDLAHWVEQPPLAVHNGVPNQAWHEIESVQLHEKFGLWHMFFTELNVQGVQYLKSANYDSGWDFTQAVTIDLGIAPELTDVGNDTYLFSRHLQAPIVAELSTFWTIRVDSLRFNGIPLPYVVRTQPLAQDWPSRTGTCFDYGPTFGDNSAERAEEPTEPVGNGYLSSREYYGGPLSGFGSPGGVQPDNVIGSIRSRVFTVTGDSLMMELGGGDSPFVEVRLVRDSDDLELASASPTGGHRMRTVSLPISAWQGTDCYIEVVDNAIAPDGYIHVDEIREVLSTVPAPGPVPGIRAARLLQNVPNPFNPRTEIRWAQTRPGRVSLEIFDLRGRRVKTLNAGFRDPGDHSIIWAGRDDAGAEVASAVYLVRLAFESRETDRRAITLVR